MALDNARAGESRTPKAVEHKAETSVPGPLHNRSTQGYCRNCGSRLGDFYNSWHKITGSVRGCAVGLAHGTRANGVRLTRIVLPPGAA